MKVKPVNPSDFGVRLPLRHQKLVVMARQVLYPHAVLATVRRGPKSTEAVANALRRFEKKLCVEPPGVRAAIGPQHRRRFYRHALVRLVDLSRGPNPKITRKDGLWTAL